MEIGDSIIIGRMGQQPLRITDTTVDPQHASLRRLDKDTFQIEDNNSAKGIFVFGIRIKRKTIKYDTPIFIGSYKTSVRRLLTDMSDINLEDIWNEYDKEKRKWDRYSMMVNSIRMFTPVVTMFLTQVVGQNWLVSCGALIAVMIIAIVSGEKILEKKNMAMATLNAKMQDDYVCPHCRKFFGFVPFKVLKSKIYCQHCGVPIK